MPIIALADAPHRVQLFVKAHYAEDFSTRLATLDPDAVGRLRSGNEPFTTALAQWRYDTDTNEVVTSSDSRWPITRVATTSQATLRARGIDEAGCVRDDARPGATPLPPVRPARL